MVRSDLTNNYIKTYDNVLTKDQCQHLIDKFEDSSNQWVKTELENHRSFTEINLNLHSDWEEYAKLLFDKFRPLVDKYVKDVKIDTIKQWPEKFGFEQVRFKKYEDNDKDECCVTFPDNLLEAANLKEGDEIEWIDQGDGAYILRKVVKIL